MKEINKVRQNTDLKVIDVKVLNHLKLLIEFSNGEKRNFDAKQLLKYPVYQDLENDEIFNNVAIENGILVWDNGKIDVGTDFLYQKSETLSWN